MDLYFDPAVVSGGAGTLLSPWNPNQVPSKGVAGDRLLFKIDGIYGAPITYTRSGSAGNPIQFDLYGSGVHNPIFDGGGSGSPTFQFTGCNFITLNNLVARNTTSQFGPFSFNSCTNITLNNCATIESTTGIKNTRGMNFSNCGANLVLNRCWFHGFSDNATHTHGGGSGVQFNNCNGGGIIVNNVKTQVEVTPGTSGQTDGVGDIISIYQCYGTNTNWSVISQNQQRGGSSHTAGYAAAVIGDVGGSYQRYINNTIVNTGKVLLQVQGGTFMDMSGNNCFGDYFPYNSVGMAFGNYSGMACNNVTMQNNRIRFKRTATTYYNKWWDAAPKTFPAFQPAGWNLNTGDSTNDTTTTPLLDDTLLPNPLFRIIDYPWDIGGVTPPVMTFPAISAKVYGIADFTPGASGPNPITYTSSDITIATIVSGKIHIVKAGSCTITASDGTTTIPQVLTINKAALTITADAKSKNYGSGNPALSVSYSGFVLGESSTVLTVLPSLFTTATTSSPVGTYNIVPSGAIANNYSFTYVNGTITVTKVTLTVSADAKTKVYGAVMPSLTVSYSGFVNGDTASNLTTQPTPATAATGSSVVGSYAITVGGGISTNYNFTYLTGALAITKAFLTITADDKSKAQGSVNPALTATYTGLVNGDTSGTFGIAPTLSTTAITLSPAGTYPIMLLGASSANYNISLVPGILTVSSSSIVFPSIGSKVYGTPDFDPGATSAGNTITYTSDNTAVATIIANQVHIISPGSANIIADNGSITSSQPLTVTKAPLAVTSDNHVIFVGNPIPTLSMSYSGFVNSESSLDLTTQPTSTTSATMGSPVGAYAIVPASGVSGKYSFTYINGSLNIVDGAMIIVHKPIRLQS